MLSCMYVLASVWSSIIIFNLLVAYMENSYGKIFENVEASSMREKSSMILQEGDIMICGRALVSEPEYLFVATPVILHPLYIKKLKEVLNWIDVKVLFP